MTTAREADPLVIRRLEFLGGTIGETTMEVIGAGVLMLAITLLCVAPRYQDFGVAAKKELKKD